MAEVIWRWTFSGTTIALCLFATVRLQRSVVVLAEEQEMLTSKAPLQVVQAILEIWQRARPLVLRLGVIIVPALILLWVVAATVGRAYVTHRIAAKESPGRPDWVSLAVLNLLRVIALLLLVPAYILAAMATLSVSTPESPNHLLALLVFLVLFSIAVLIWSIVNWMLSLASIYATVARASLFQALRDAWLLLRSRTSQLAAIAAQNATVRTLVGVVFTVIALAPLALRSIPAVFWSLEIAIFLLYCVLSDLLLLARLSAYVEVVGQVRTAEN